MNKLYLAFLFLIFAGTVLAQNPFNGDITFRRQAELDAFITGTVKYTSVTGNLIINPSASNVPDPIDDFENLNKLESIGGFLRIINYNTERLGPTAPDDPLGTLSLLESVENLFIGNNTPGNTAISAVTNSSLTTVTNRVQIRNSLNAESIALDGLETTGGSFQVNDMIALTSVSLPQLQDVGNNLILSGLAELTTFSANNLTNIDNSLILENLDRFDDLEGLSFLETIGNDIEIFRVPLLSNLEDLGENVPTGRPVYQLRKLTLIENDGLTSLNTIQAVIRNELNLQNNVNLTSIGPSVDLSTTGTVQKVYIIENPVLADLDDLFDPVDDSRIGTLRIEDNDLLSSAGTQPLRITDTLSILRNGGLASAPNLSATVSLTAFELIDNDQLQTFGSLSNLTSVTGIVTVTDNGGLLDLTGLSGLETIGTTFLLNNNDALTDLDDLSPTINIGTFLSIVNNDNLGNCCQLSPDARVAGQPVDGDNGSVTIAGNTGDCADKSSYTAACITAAPVEFLAFTGQLGTGAIDLDWATATETDNSHFQVERSIAGGAFVAIGRVAGAGDSKATLTYRFSDPGYASGVNYYRLRQVDYDGTEAFSDVVAVDAGGTTQSLNIYPNPTTGGEVSVQLGADWQVERVVAEVFNASGQSVLRSVSNNGQLVLPMGDLQTGIYAVRISEGSRSVTERLVVR